MTESKDNEIILNVDNISVEFRLNQKRRLPTVTDLSFKIHNGETLGLVGESGCGKTSLAKAIMQLPPPTSGKVLLCGEDLTRAPKQHLRKLRSQFQIVFQDSISALNLRRSIGDTIAMGLHINRIGTAIEKKQQVLEMMNLVGLDPELFDRKPYELSGGQCQRIQIARALITRPKLLILDEPVSSLNVSVQAQILNLLEKLRKRYGLTMLFISHDLSVVKNVCDRVAVMYLGIICEIGSSDHVYRSPLHPYTRALLKAIPKPDPLQRNSRVSLASEESLSAVDSLEGCRFKKRCPKAEALCEKEVPKLKEVTADHWTACHLHDQR